MAHPKHGIAHNGNGHRRRQLTARIKATATHCVICKQPLRPDLKWPHKLSNVIDEDVPRSRGGSPYDPANCGAAHSLCNGWKSTMTLAEAHALLAAGADVTQPLRKVQRKALANPGVGSWSLDAETY